MELTLSCRPRRNNPVHMDLWEPSDHKTRNTYPQCMEYIETPSSNSSLCCTCRWDTNTQSRIEYPKDSTIPQGMQEAKMSSSSRSCPSDMSCSYYCPSGPGKNQPDMPSALRFPKDTSIPLDTTNEDLTWDLQCLKDSSSQASTSESQTQCRCEDSSSPSSKKDSRWPRSNQ